MEQNKTGKYLKYAVGEIVLVVIGILVALSINNWNEVKKQQIEASTYLQNMTRFIDENLWNTFDLWDVRTKDSIMYHVLNKDTLAYSNSSFYQGNRTNPLSIYNDNTEFIWNKNFDIILENQKILPESYSNIINVIREMKAVRDGFLKSKSETLKEMSSSNRELMMTNYDWYPFTDSISNQKRMKYYFSDFSYYNHLFEFRRQYNQRATQIIRIRALKAALWAEIKLKRLLKLENTLEEQFQYWEMNKLKELACDDIDTITPSIHQFRAWNVIINKSKDTIFYSRKMVKEYGNFDYILPGEIETVSSRYNEYVYILTNQGCINKLKTTLNGYWINY